MDPLEFGVSTLPLQHSPYDLISSSTLSGTNANKVAVITGAARGIGAAISHALAKSGANVALLDLNVVDLQDTMKKCIEEGVKVSIYSCDVANAEDVDKIFKKVQESIGPIDILVNNAGILDSRPFIMAEFEDFWRQIEVNFKAPLLTTHALLPSFRERGGGCIINIASRSGTVDVPMTLGYVTSKAALIRATHTLQREMELDGLDPNIHIYALHPGGVLTGMGGSAAKQDVLDKYGDVRDEKFFMELFKDGPELCGQTCAFLASGRGKELRGLYLDCRQDLGKLLEHGRIALLKEKRNVLTVNFLEGYANEP